MSSPPRVDINWPLLAERLTEVRIGGSGATPSLCVTNGPTHHSVSWLVTMRTETDTRTNTGTFVINEEIVIDVVCAGDVMLIAISPRPVAAEPVPQLSTYEATKYVVITHGYWNRLGGVTVTTS
jgi:hypothetical protein